MADDDTPAARNANSAKLLVLGLGALIVVPALLLGGGDDEQPAAAPSAGAWQPVTAQTLAEAFVRNPVGAQELYGDRPLLVTGMVDAIVIQASHPVIDLAPGDAVVPAEFAIGAESIGALANGDEIAVQCAFLQAGDRPYLNDCALAEK